MSRTAEYRDIKGQPMAARVVVDTKPASRLKATVELATVAAGWECAGSMARWTDGYWSVRWRDTGGSYQGRRFELTDIGEQEARALFTRLTVAGVA